jgi:hypothetical protein
MGDLEKTIAEIEKKNSKLDKKSQNELLGLLQSVNDYLSIQPKDKDLRTIRFFVRKKLAKEGNAPISIYVPDLLIFQQLRNAIVHNKPLDEKIMLEFGERVWKILEDLYSDDRVALYNILSFSFQSKGSQLLKTDNSMNTPIPYFHKIYKTKSASEKIAIIRTLIPLVESKIKQKQETLSKTVFRP